VLKIVKECLQKHGNPRAIPHGQSVNTSKGVQHVLRDVRAFKSVHGDAMEYLTSSCGFFLAFDDPVKRAYSRKETDRKGAWKDRSAVSTSDLPSTCPTSSLLSFKEGLPSKRSRTHVHPMPPYYRRHPGPS